MMTPNTFILCCVCVLSCANVVAASLVFHALRKQYETLVRTLDCFDALQISIGNSIIEGTL